MKQQTLNVILLRSTLEECTPNTDEIGVKIVWDNIN